MAAFVHAETSLVSPPDTVIPRASLGAHHEPGVDRQGCRMSVGRAVGEVRADVESTV